MTAADETEALRAATREAHEALTDLRAATREARAEVDRIKATAAEVYETRIEADVKTALEQYRDTIARSIEAAERAVYARFDEIASVLLGEHRRQRRRGETTLGEYAQRAVGGTLLVTPRAPQPDRKKGKGRR